MDSMDFRMTVGMCRRACKEHRFLLFRDIYGGQFGVNSMVITATRANRKHHGNKKTEWVSFQPCNFHEYISKKMPFITKEWLERQVFLKLINGDN